MDYALILSGFAFTVGVVGEEHGTPAVSVLPETFDKLATNPETVHKMAAVPESRPVMAAKLEPAHIKPAS